MTTAAFRWKVFGVASILATSILLVVVVAQRPAASGGTPVVDTAESVAHAIR